MRRVAAFAALVALAFTTPACSFVSARRVPQAPTAGQPASATLASKLGRSTPLAKAVQLVDFAPYIPAQGQLIDVAVISPLSGADSRKTIGIAFEYAADGRAMVLQEWPQAKAQLKVGSADLATSLCTPSPFKDGGLMWATPGHLVMALQADGKTKPSNVSVEARRLLSHGACR